MRAERVINWGGNQPARSDGYLVPVQRSIMRQDGIAKASLELMVQNP